MKKIKFGLSQFSLGNTPKMLEKVGNIGLIFAVIGTFIIGIPATLEASGVNGFVVPAFLMTAAKVCLAIGTLTKALTKMFGQIETIESNSVNNAGNNPAN